MSARDDWSVRGGAPLRGSVRVPGDKSISHRALLLAALARGRSRIEGALLEGDVAATLRSVRAFGAEAALDGTALIVTSRGTLQEPDAPIDCGRAATTLRLTAGVAAAQPFVTVLTGAAQLRCRPMDRLVTSLSRLGAHVTARADGTRAPVTILGGTVRAGAIELPVASAQVKSAVLLAGLCAGVAVTVREPVRSRDHTERMLQALGHDVDVRADGLVAFTPRAPRDALHEAFSWRVPGDVSSAAFLVVAATLVGGSSVVIENVGVNPTRTGLLDVLSRMGARIERVRRADACGEPTADLVVEAAALRATDVAGADVVRSIDELVLFAVAATQAVGVSRVRDAAALRAKECDRLAETARALRALGARIEVEGDGWVIEGPTPLVGASVDCASDHRLAMALAVAGLVATQTTHVRGGGCARDSFPNFVRALSSLQGDIAEERC